MDENIVKFQEKLKNLYHLEKEKGNPEIQEINDFFSDMELMQIRWRRYLITLRQITLMCSESVMTMMIFRMKS